MMQTCEFLRFPLRERSDRFGELPALDVGLLDFGAARRAKDVDVDVDEHFAGRELVL
jgi:hypothetical protein